MNCTLVSAFYPIRSKFSKDKYLEWGRTFMKVESPLVFFTEQELIPELSKLRENRPVLFIPIPFEELDTWKLYKDKWIEHHKIDPENSYHTPELYAIWAQKAFFVEKAIQKNHFNTDYFFWCDFGAFRNSNIDNIILKTFPQSKYFKDNKIIFQAINNLQESDKYMRDDGIHGEKLSKVWNEVRLVGGLWGGSSFACINWKNEYKTMLEKYFDKGRFAGKDQIVMLSTYLHNPELAYIVKSTLSNIDNWFFFEYLLSDLNVNYELDTTYILNNEINNKPIISVNIMGGLGNQMFQIASAYAYTKKYNGNLKIERNKRNYDRRPLYWDSILHKCTPYLVDNIPQHLAQWRERDATEYTEMPQLNQQGIYLNGYLQSDKYFYNNNIRNEIKELFRPSCDNITIIKNKYKSLLDRKDRVIVVHARRTDYCQNQMIINFHGPLQVQYYKEAIPKISNNIIDPIFLLVSDDPTYWLSVIPECPILQNNNIYILNNENEINTMVLLQQFNYFVIANSTFSWWCAYLSKNPKKVIAPSKWFGPAGPKNYSDIYLPEWELI